MTLLVRRLLTSSLAVLVTAALGATLTASPASAADNGSWAIGPSDSSANVTTNRAFFNIESVPGQVIQDSVEIQNVTDGPLTLELYPADAFNSGGGGFALKRKDEEQKDLGTWITLETDQVVLEAQQKVDVGFTMTVPAGATPGDHVGGIVALNPVATPTETAEGAVIQVQQAVGVRIYTRIAGPTSSSLVVNSVDMQIEGGGVPGLRFPERAIITFSVTNTGNVTVNPEAIVEVDGAFGRNMFSSEITVPELLPGNEEPIVFTQVYDDPAFIERMKATVTLTDEDGEVLAKGDDVVWSAPWLALLLLALGGGAWYAWRRRREAGDVPVDDLISDRPRDAHATSSVD